MRFFFSWDSSWCSIGKYLYVFIFPLTNMLQNNSSNKIWNDWHYSSFNIVDIVVLIILANKHFAWCLVNNFLKKYEMVKGYLHCKIITFQNVASEAQINNFFMIYQISDVTMSISTWDMVHFWIYLLNYNSWIHQTWSVDRCKQGQ